MKIKPANTLFLAWAAFSGLAAPAVAQTVQDANGNPYNTVTIGTQKWMKENLKATAYHGGTAIPTTTPATEDISMTPIPSVYQWAYNGDAANTATYGLLYTYDAANGTPPSMTLARKICPVGYHIPTAEDWTTLVTYLGGTGLAPNKMKEAGTTYWSGGNQGTNSSEFSSRAGGQKSANGTFSNLKIEAYYWTSTVVSGTEAKAFSTSTSSTHAKRKGFSVRCISDTAVTSSGIGEDSSPNSFKMAHNQASGKVTILLPGNGVAKSILVYNVAGKMVMTFANTNKLDLSGAPRGIYFLKIGDGAVTRTHRYFLQ